MNWVRLDVGAGGPYQCTNSTAGAGAAACVRGVISVAAFVPFVSVA